MSASVASLSRPLVFDPKNAGLTKPVHPADEGGHAIGADDEGGHAIGADALAGAAAANANSSASTKIGLRARLDDGIATAADFK